MRWIFALVTLLSLISCSRREPGVFFCGNAAYKHFPSFDRFKMALNLEHGTFYTDDVGGKLETVSNSKYVAIVRPFLLSIPRNLGNTSASWEVAGHQFTQVRTSNMVIISSKGNSNTNSLTDYFTDTIAVLDSKGNVKEINILRLRDGEMETDRWYACGVRQLNWKTMYHTTTDFGEPHSKR